MKKVIFLLLVAVSLLGSCLLIDSDIDVDSDITINNDLPPNKLNVAFDDDAGVDPDLF